MDLFLPIAHMDVNIVLILSYGAIVGFLSGLIGVGGGFLITPLLIFTGVPPIVAVSSGAAQMAGTAAGASFLHWRNGNIDIKLGLFLLSGSGAGALIGVHLASRLLRNGQFGNVVGLLYVVLLGLIGSSMLVESLRALLRSKQPVTDALNPAAWRAHVSACLQRLPWQVAFSIAGVRTSALVPLVLGAVIGLLTSIMGVGGGFIMVPALIYLLRLPVLIVVGTSLFQMLFTTAGVSIMQAGINHAVDPVLALLLLGGSMLGTRVGAHLSGQLREEKIRLVFALVVVAVALRMVGALVATPADMYSISLERY